MPDVLVKTRTVSAKEFETVQANGYASLKNCTPLRSVQLENYQNAVV